MNNLQAKLSALAASGAWSDDLRERARALVSADIEQRGADAAGRELASLLDAAPAADDRTVVNLIGEFARLCVEADHVIHPDEGQRSADQPWPVRLWRALSARLRTGPGDVRQAAAIAMYWLVEAYPPLRGTAGDSRAALAAIMVPPHAFETRLAASIVLWPAGDGSTSDGSDGSMGDGASPEALELIRETLDRQLGPGSPEWRLLGDARRRLAEVVRPRHGDVYDAAGGALAVSDPMTLYYNIGFCRAVMDRWRSAPAALAPRLVALFDTPVSGLRAAAVTAVSRAGDAARSFAPELVSMTDEPLARVAPAGNQRHAETITAEAMAALLRLGDARAVPLACRYVQQPFGQVDTRHIVSGLRGQDEAIEAVRTILREGAGDTSGHRHVAAVLSGLTDWQDDAAALVPELGVLLDDEQLMPAALAVLAGIGPRAARVAPLVATLADRPDQSPWVRASAARALLSFGDPWAGRAVTRLRELLASDATVTVAVTALARAGHLPDDAFPAGVLADRVAPLLHSPKATVASSAARALWRCGADAREVAATLVAASGPSHTGIEALGWLADLGTAASSHREALARAVHADRRPDEALLGEYPVLADEAFVAAGRRALAAISDQGNAHQFGLL
jgi:hypothetical protein